MRLFSTGPPRHAATDVMQGAILNDLNLGADHVDVGRTNVASILAGNDRIALA